MSDYPATKVTVGHYRVCYALTPDGHYLGWSENHRGYLVGEPICLATLDLAKAWQAKLVELGRLYN